MKDLIVSKASLSISYLGVWQWTASGFPLKNVEGTNVYPGLNVNECQYLCEITQNCLYFVYNIGYSRCRIKFGLADEIGAFGFNSNTFIGHKLSSSKYLCKISTIT